METITLVNKGKARHSRSRVSMTSPKSWWTAGTRDMNLETIAGGLTAGLAATVIPNSVGWADGWKGIVSAGLTAIIGTVVIGKYVSGKAALGFGIVGATVVVNRAFKMAMGVGVPYLSGALGNSGVGGFLGRLGQTTEELFGQTSDEIFGAETFGYGNPYGETLEPTYMGYGTHLS